MPDYRVHLLRGISGFLVALRRGELDEVVHSRDTRPNHEQFFSDLTPPECPYYAGHYRGEPFRCLKDHWVGIQNDPSVGFPPSSVPSAMWLLASHIDQGIAALDQADALPSAQLADDDKALYVVVFACRIFERFLRAHPYVNGNGHMARAVIWLILGRFGYWPLKWTIDPRPANQEYVAAIVQYRAGNFEPLEKLVLECLS